MTGFGIIGTMVGVALISSLALANPADILPEDAYYRTESINKGGSENNYDDYQLEESYGADSRAIPSSVRSRSVNSDNSYSDAYKGANYRRRQTRDDDYSPLDDIRIHGGVALINSIQQVPVNGSALSTASTHGIQANLGIDLFSPNWIAEGSVLNYPETRQDDFSVASNAFELKIFYTAPIFERITLHGGPGVSSRNFTIRADSSASDRSISTANTVLAIGANYWVSGHLSIGLEGTARMPMISATDPQSNDFSVRIDGHF